MKNHAAKAPTMYTLILYICSLVLFLEWLFPLGVITDTGHISVFIIYTLFCFLISGLNVYWWLSFTVKGAGLLFVINTLFFDDSIFELEWLNVLWTDLLNNVGFLLHQDWNMITPIFRSLLFLILIWLMSYLLYYWFVTMRYVFVFIVLTIVYVGLLDTFTTYHGQMAMIRIVIVALISLGLTNLIKEQAREGLDFPKASKRLSWIMPIVIMTLLSVGFGYVAPKFGPQWPDPLPFIESMADKPGEFSFGGNSRTVGYGEDDTKLGGSFVQDETPVFQAEATEKQYWRIETKDVYTGKGWERSEDASLDEQENGISLRTFENGVETDSLETDITFTGDVELTKLVYPYGITTVKTDSDADYFLDESSESIHTKSEGEKVSLSSYTIRYDQPAFDLDALKNVSEDDPRDIKEQYTQLPDELPERVDELAAEITESYSNRYDKAKAVKQYFGRNDFVYQISDVPVPDEDQDYVDQFLYDTKAGYCDNYSTSMVVMLRTLDIPSRWVKGFTGGDVVDDQETDDDDKTIYEITNSNAHSWVEVYFPGIGWVPFEPTQGFSNEADFYEEGNDPDDDILDPSEQETDDSSSEDTSENDSDNETEESDEEQTENASDETNESHFSYWYLWVLIIPVIALLRYGYYKRYHIRAYWLGKKVAKNQGDPEIYSQAYLFLFRVMMHKGFEKAPQQTLREFAGQVDRRLGGNDMRRITAYYEEMVYNKTIRRVDGDFYDLWRRLMDRILKDK